MRSPGGLLLRQTQRQEPFKVLTVKKNSLPVLSNRMLVTESMPLKPTREAALKKFQFEN